MIKAVCDKCETLVAHGELLGCCLDATSVPVDNCGCLGLVGTVDVAPETTYEDYRASLDAAQEAFLPSMLAVESGPDIKTPQWSESTPEQLEFNFDAPFPFEAPAATTSYPDDNPKTALGLAKPSFTAIPPTALIHMGQAMSDGRRKYGLMNWREKRVTTSVYVDAMMRHLLAYWDGENVASDSKVSHLGHVMACAAIILDAEANGSLNDDRPIPGPFADIVAALTVKAA